MSAAPGAVSDVLTVAGCAIAVLATLAMALMPAAENRLHYLAPVTSLAAPLIGAGLVVRHGLSLTSGEIALTVVVLAFTGPAVTAAVGRTHSERMAARDEEPE